MGWDAALLPDYINPIKEIEDTTNLSKPTTHILRVVRRVGSCESGLCPPLETRYETGVWRVMGIARALCLRILGEGGVR